MPPSYNFRATGRRTGNTPPSVVRGPGGNLKSSSVGSDIGINDRAVSDITNAIETFKNLRAKKNIKAELVARGLSEEQARDLVQTQGLQAAGALVYNYDLNKLEQQRLFNSKVEGNKVRAAENGETPAPSPPPTVLNTLGRTPTPRIESGAVLNPEWKQIVPRKLPAFRNTEEMFDQIDRERKAAKRSPLETFFTRLMSGEPEVRQLQEGDGSTPGEIPRPAVEPPPLDKSESDPTNYLTNLTAEEATNDIPDPIVSDPPLAGDSSDTTDGVDTAMVLSNPKASPEAPAPVPLSEKEQVLYNNAVDSNPFTHKALSQEQKDLLNPDQATLNKLIATNNPNAFDYSIATAKSRAEGRQAIRASQAAVLSENRALAAALPFGAPVFLEDEYGNSLGAFTFNKNTRTFDFIEGTEGLKRQPLRRQVALRQPGLVKSVRAKLQIDAKNMNLGINRLNRLDNVARDFPEFFTLPGQVSMSFSEFVAKLTPDLQTWTMGKLNDSKIGTYAKGLGVEVNFEKLNAFGRFKFLANNEFLLFRREMTGLAGPIQELEFIRKTLFNTEDSQETFLAKLDELRAIRLDVRDFANALLDNKDLGSSIENIEKLVSSFATNRLNTSIYDEFHVQGRSLSKVPRHERDYLKNLVERLEDLNFNDDDLGE